MARGAAWMVALRSVDRLLGLASTLVLARLLVPEDFGLLALGMAVVGSLAAFSEFSFDIALIQNQEANRKHYDTAWTLGLLRGALLAGLLLLIAQPAAHVMGEDRLRPLIIVLALAPLLESFANIGVVDFRKQLVFGKEFLYIISSRVAGVVVTVTLAVIWRDYWALVVGQISVQVIRSFLSYLLHPYRPALTLVAWRELLHFSKWLLANGIIIVAIKRAPTFVIGSALGVASVGIFTLSNEISGLISQSVVAPIKRAFFPGYAKLADDIKLLNKGMLRAHGVVLCLAAPATIGIGLTADLFIPIALDQSWLSTVPIVEILAVDAFLIALQGQVRPVFMAVNRPEYTTYLTIVYAAALVPGVIVGVWLADLPGVAWAAVGARLIQTLSEFYALNRVLKISFADILHWTWRTLAACLAMIVVVVWSEGVLVQPNEALVSELSLDLIAIVLIGAASYALSLLALWCLSGQPQESAEGIALAMLKGLLRKRAGTQISSSNP